MFFQECGFLNVTTLMMEVAYIHIPAGRQVQRIGIIILIAVSISKSWASSPSVIFTIYFPMLLSSVYNNTVEEQLIPSLLTPVK